MKHRVLPEPDAVLAQTGPLILVQLFHVFGDVTTRQDSKRLDKPKADAARHSREGLVVAKRDQRRELGRDPPIDPVTQTPADLLADLGGRVLVHEGLD